MRNTHMKTRLTYMCLLGVLVWLLDAEVLFAGAENWPRWRGPRNDGSSTEINLPTRWSQTENVRWRVELPGPAPSTPIVWQDRIFLTSTEGADLILLCFN